MQYAQLGRSNLKVSRIAFGCEQLGGIDWGPYDREAGVAAVRRALDCGINFFDTADVYALGGSEETLAAALGASRKNVVIATKVGVNWEIKGPNRRAKTWYDLRPQRIIEALHASLRRLRLDCIPLYFLHWPDSTTPLEQSLGCLVKLQEAGKIQHIGLSRFSAEQIRTAHSITQVAAVELEYNLLSRSAESTILPCCRELGIGVTVFGPLAQGMLTGKYGSADRFGSDDRRSRLPHFQFPALNHSLEMVERLRRVSSGLGGAPLPQVAINWLLSNPDVTSVITGIRNPCQVDDNCTSLNWRLSSADILQLSSNADQRQN